MIRILSVLAFFILCFCVQTVAQTYNYTFSYGAAGQTRTLNLDDGWKPSGTMSFTFSGAPCDGAEIVDRWTSVIRVDGTTLSGWKATPWNPVDVTITSFQVQWLTSNAHQNIYVGSNFVNDVMVALDNGSSVGWNGTPSGSGYPFPGTNDAPPNTYFDVHGACTGGGTGQIRLDIAYSPLANPLIPNSSTVSWNPSDKGNYVGLTNFNLTAAGAGGQFNAVRANLSHHSGKYYWENHTDLVTGSVSVTGFATGGMTVLSYVGANATSIGIQTGGTTSQNGFTIVNNAGTTWAGGDVENFAIDFDAGKIWLGKNNTWLNSGNPATGANPWATFTPGTTLFPAWSSADASDAGTARFTRDQLTGTLPSGYSAWDGTN